MQNGKRNLASFCYSIKRYNDTQIFVSTSVARKNLKSYLCSIECNTVIIFEEYETIESVIYRSIRK